MPALTELTGRARAGAAQYPAPEGWSNDGVWRDSAIDSNYETTTQRAVRPDADDSREEPGYSYWADGKGWESKPGPNAQLAAGTGAVAIASALALC